LLKRISPFWSKDRGDKVFDILFWFIKLFHAKAQRSAKVQFIGVTNLHSSHSNLTPPILRLLEALSPLSMWRGGADPATIIMLKG
jgi:hypothetical protein